MSRRDEPLIRRRSLASSLSYLADQIEAETPGNARMLGCAATLRSLAGEQGLSRRVSLMKPDEACPVCGDRYLEECFFSAAQDTGGFVACRNGCWYSFRDADGTETRVMTFGDPTAGAER